MNKHYKSHSYVDRQFEEFTFTPAVFKPVVDAAFSLDPFLPDNRRDIVVKGKHNKVSLRVNAEYYMYSTYIVYRYSSFF